MYLEFWFYQSLKRKNSLETDLSVHISSWLHLNSFEDQKYLQNFSLPNMKGRKGVPCLCCCSLLCSFKCFSSWFAWNFTSLFVCLFVFPYNLRLYCLWLDANDRLHMVSGAPSPSSGTAEAIRVPSCKPLCCIATCYPTSPQSARGVSMQHTSRSTCIDGPAPTSASRHSPPSSPDVLTKKALCIVCLFHCKTTFLLYWGCKH